MSLDACIAMAIVGLGVIALCVVAERLRDDDDGPSPSGGAA